MDKKLFIVLAFGILLVGSVSAMSVDYYYHPECGHCQKIAPFMDDVSNFYRNVNWNMYDTSIMSFDGGTPTLFVKTGDGRKIKMIGSDEIPRYLQCELNEQSNLNCPTYSASECIAESWFLRE